MSSPYEIDGCHEITAFDFYDGAIEGLARSIKQCRNCYFKLIAWDSGQDKRLYAITEVDESKYNKLLALLARTQERSSTPVWLPSWSFYNEIDKQKANKLVESFQAALPSSKLLALGEDICDDSLSMFQANEQAVYKLSKSLMLDKPDVLSDWMLVLSQCTPRTSTYY